METACASRAMLSSTIFQRLGISKHGQATFTHRTQAEPRKNVLSTSLANPEQVITIIIGERNVKMNIVLFGGR